jgi:hypothetical protein
MFEIAGIAQVYVNLSVRSSWNKQIDINCFGALALDIFPCSFARWGKHAHDYFLNVLWLVPVGLSKANLVDLAITTCYLDFMHR